MKLVVGLGNPGARYAESPHNFGFRVLDKLLAELGGVFHRRFEGLIAQVRVSAGELLLLEPMTYMNRSGQSVRQALAFYGMELSEVLVVHDELDLPPGSVKLKRGGGEAGHNGLKSLALELGSRDFSRLRLGVGRPPAGVEVADFLLQPLPPELARELELGYGRAREAIELWAREGLERAMNLVNRAQQAGPGGSTPPD